MAKNTGLEKLVGLGFALDTNFKNNIVFNKFTEKMTYMLCINFEGSINSFYESADGFYGEYQMTSAERHALIQYKREQAAV